MADVALSDDLRQAVARGRRDLAWLLAPVDALEARTLAAEAAARGAAFREGEAANEAAVLRARLATADALAAQRDELIATMMDAHEGHKRAAVYADRLLAEAVWALDALTARADVAEAEAARRTDEVVAIGAALGREGATAAECVAEADGLRAANERLRGMVDAQRRTMARAGAEIPAALAPLTAWGPPMPCVGRVLAMADGLAREGSER